MINDSEIVIIGANGQLGQALQAHFPGARAVDADKLDITDATAVKNFAWQAVKYILNAAAYTNVDGAESPEGRVAAWRVNAVGPANLAIVARNNGATLVHISSDYVFDGTKPNHTEDEPFSPLGVYGQTKAAGDIAVSTAPNHYILRTSWVIGDGKNFVRTMLGLGEKGISPTVVADQIGRLTFTNQLVQVIEHLLTNKAAYGTYNVSNSGEAASWADVTREIFAAAGYSNLTVTDTTTEEYFTTKPGTAPRPLSSSLSLDKLVATGFKTTDWKTDLQSYIDKEKAV